MSGAVVYQGDYDFAVRVRLVIIRDFGLLPQGPVIIDFAIDGKGEGFFSVDDGLCASVWTIVSRASGGSSEGGTNTNADDTEITRAAPAPITEVV